MITMSGTMISSKQLPYSLSPYSSKFNRETYNYNFSKNFEDNRLELELHQYEEFYQYGEFYQNYEFHQ